MNGTFMSLVVVEAVLTGAAVVMFLCDLALTTRNGSSRSGNPQYAAAP